MTINHEAGKLLQESPSKRTMHFPDLIKHDSSLIPDDCGILKLHLIQTSSGSPVVGDRERVLEAQRPRCPTQKEIDACEAIIQSSQGCALTVMAAHPGLSACQEQLSKLTHDRTIVGLAGISAEHENENRLFIFTGRNLIIQNKISLSSEDVKLGVKPGNQVHLFTPSEPRAIKWAALNCHDYTHVDILRSIQRLDIELLVVVTYNPASGLYWHYAISDIHRLFCFVVIANIAEFGGSGAFAPFRRIGESQHAQINAGGQLFWTRGAGNLDVEIGLDFDELRRLRELYSRLGFSAKVSNGTPASIYTPVTPPENFHDSYDRRAGPPYVSQVVDHEIIWNSEQPRIAVAQLKDIGYPPYIESRYRIRNHPSCGPFLTYLRRQLSAVEATCEGLGRTPFGTMLDFLILPEVFVPRCFINELQNFSDQLGAIVIAGLDYPEVEECHNANECVILRPSQSPVYYRKVTRSQYDALGPNNSRMEMNRGDSLLRFTDRNGRGFGVLICYDFSHFDLVYRLNMDSRSEPLDFIIVVAHNPFSELYRSCCIADAHRFYQFVVMCNVSRFGGSGVFGPTREKGARLVLLEAGKGIETIAITDLPLSQLRKSRNAADEDLNIGPFMRKSGIFQALHPK
jgi:predicted amidohydrolase